MRLRLVTRGGDRVGENKEAVGNRWPIEGAGVATLLLVERGLWQLSGLWKEVCGNSLACGKRLVGL